MDMNPRRGRPPRSKLTKRAVVPASSDHESDSPQPPTVRRRSMQNRQTLSYRDDSPDPLEDTSFTSVSTAITAPSRRIPTATAKRSAANPKCRGSDTRILSDNLDVLALSSQDSDSCSTDDESDYHEAAQPKGKRLVSRAESSKLNRQAPPTHTRRACPRAAIIPESPPRSNAPEASPLAQPRKRGRGRPRKLVVQVSDSEDDDESGLEGDDIHEEDIAPPVIHIHDIRPPRSPSYYSGLHQNSEVESSESELSPIADGSLDFKQTESGDTDDVSEYEADTPPANNKQAKPRTAGRLARGRGRPPRQLPVVFSSNGENESYEEEVEDSDDSNAGGQGERRNWSLTLKTLDKLKANRRWRQPDRGRPRKHPDENHHKVARTRTRSSTSIVQASRGEDEERKYEELSETEAESESSSHSSPAPSPVRNPRGRPRQRLPQRTQRGANISEGSSEGESQSESEIQVSSDGSAPDPPPFRAPRRRHFTGVVESPFVAGGHQLRKRRRDSDSWGENSRRLRTRRASTGGDKAIDVIDYPTDSDYEDPTSPRMTRRRKRARTMSPSAADGQASQDQDPCPICYLPFTNMVPVVLPCGNGKHQFCLQCFMELRRSGQKLSGWLLCPVCRAGHSAGIINSALRLQKALAFEEEDGVWRG
ncbi:hypothetical protein MKZ38_005438 [Zalerion maritima]|uniref:RING-type domain-containing protein n=1 Tax=Zalerion maritima TaxID=339359 RepID=A0AAD5RL70_9PEZI|nr:hypothetical protein MKZ38_005438 [Zalerion maritima]